MMIKKSIQSALILGMVCSAGLTAHAHSDWMQRSPQSISESMSNVDMKLKLDLLKANFGVFKLGFKYTYRAKPTYKDQMFSREDSYVLDTTLADGVVEDIGEDYDISLIPSIQHKGQLTFVRLFPTHVEARTASPYNPYEHFPLNSQEILTKLKAGDLVSLKSKLNVSMNVDANMIAGGDFKNYGKISALVGGDFELIILKQSNDEILLRLISTSRNEKSVEYSFEYTDLVDPTGSRIVNKTITRLLDPKLVQLLFKKGHGESTLAEYRIDLKNPQAQKAMDQLLNSTYKFKAQTEAIKDLDIKRVNERMTLNLAEFDQLTDAKTYSEIGDSVKKTSNIKNDQGYSSGRFKIGFRGLFLDGKNNYSRNYLTRTDENNKTEHFAILSYRRLFEDGAFFKFGSETDIQMNAVLTTDPEFKNAKFKELVLSARRTDVQFRKDENKKMQQKLAHTLPEKYLSQIDFKEFANRSIDNSYINYQMVLSPQAFVELQKLGLTEKSTKELLTKYITHFGNTIRSKTARRHNESVLNGIEKQNPLLQYGADIDSISKILSSSLQSGKSDYQRMDEFVRLRNIPLFNVIGVGFIMTLLPQDKIEDMVALKLVMEGQNMQKIEKTFGNFQVSDDYEKLMLGVEVIYDEGMSVRRLQEAMMATQLQLPPLQ